MCHLWNLVAEETREGDVYRRLLEKLEQAREALGGQVFDVLGKLQFSGRPLRDLLLEAIRYGERPEVRARLTTVLDAALDREKLQELLEDQALAPDAMDATRVQRVREGDGAGGGAAAAAALHRVVLPRGVRAAGWLAPAAGAAALRDHPRAGRGAQPRPVDRHGRAGSRALRAHRFREGAAGPARQAPGGVPVPGPSAAGRGDRPDVERHRDLLKRGTVLVDDRDPGTAPRVLFYLEHAIQDESRTPSGDRRVVSKRLLYVELAEAEPPRHLHYAPYLDYRPLAEGEPASEAILERPECAWVTGELERQAQEHAVIHVVPEHVQEVKSARIELIVKTEAAVKDRLTKEIAYWDHRFLQLQDQEQAGKPGARLNSGEARRRAEDLRARLRQRLERLQLEAKLSALPPVILGGVLVVPRGLIAAISGKPHEPDRRAIDTQESAARARAIIMETERTLGFDPTDRETEKLGYDIESRIPGTGRLRFVEVKGRVHDADTITVTRNEILYSMNKPEDYRLAIVEFLDDGSHRVHYLREPFRREPDFDAASVNYSFKDLLARAEAPC